MKQLAVTACDIPEDRASAFAGHIVELITAAGSTAMISVGHRLGLFDTLAEMPPATSHEIAERAELAERYVREWLAVMVVARIVEYEPTGRRYHLPTEHAACLVRGARLGNHAVYAQMATLLGKVEDGVIHRFETGEGSRYDEYPCFHQIMAEDSAQTVTAGLFDHVLPLGGGIEARLSDGIDVMDAGCGRGSALLAMARRYPASRFTGYDLCEDAIQFAGRMARDAGLDNVRFEVRDLSDYAAQERWDFVTSFDAVHDQRDPAALVRRLFRALRPGGTYLMQDIGGSARLENNLDFPMAAMLYAISCAHCTPVSIGQGGRGLGTMWGWETAESLLHAAGFSPVQRHVLPHDPLNVWFVAVKS